MTPDDALYRFRLRALALAEELGSVSAACRMLGIHRSTCCRWKARAERGGLGMLRPRERRRPRMPNAASPLTEQTQCSASRSPTPASARPASSAELARPKWGGLRISRNGVWRILSRRGLGTRRKRTSRSSPATPRRRSPGANRAPASSGTSRPREPGELVQFDCFRVGRLKNTRGVLWQYTAIDVASAYAWAELHVMPGNPTA